MDLKKKEIKKNYVKKEQDEIQSTIWKREKEREE